MDVTIADQSRSPGTWRTLREYFANIGRTITTTFEGLAVTSSWLFRRPLTVQYPDKTERPVQELLPDGYRGLLEVDMDVCNGCLLCAKTCPIDSIEIEIVKNPETKGRDFTRFDIDVGKCMYCGLCSEVCKTGAIRHTTNFEATASAPGDLILHFVKSPKPVPKHKPGEGPERKAQGAVLAEVVPPLLGRRPWRARTEDK